MQCKGIGTRLVIDSMKLAKEMGHRAVVIYGYPILLMENISALHHRIEVFQNHC